MHQLSTMRRVAQLTKIVLTCCPQSVTSSKEQTLCPEQKNKTETNSTTAPRPKDIPKGEWVDGNAPAQDVSPTQSSKPRRQLGTEAGEKHVRSLWGHERTFSKSLLLNAERRKLKRFPSKEICSPKKIFPQNGDWDWAWTTSQRSDLYFTGQNCDIIILLFLAHNLKTVMLPKSRSVRGMGQRLFDPTSPPHISSCGIFTVEIFSQMQKKAWKFGSTDE